MLNAKRFFCSLFCTFLLVHCLGSQAEQNTRTSPVAIKVVGPQSEADMTSQMHFESLISTALSKSSGPWSKARIERVPYSEQAHGGVIRLVNRGIVDVYWTAPTNEKESLMMPVRIPLMAGLLGYRVAITHQDNLHKLNLHANELDKLKACQVRFWADVGILQHNQFLVVPVDSYDKTFELTSLKKCDYFPRAIYEGYSELKQAQQKYSDLAMFDDVILYYPFPLYLFTSRQNKGLNKQIYQGLNSMIEDGSFLSALSTSPLTQHLFPLSKWRDKKFIELENPHLPDSTPLDNPKYWINLQNPE